MERMPKYVLIICSVFLILMILLNISSRVDNSIGRINLVAPLFFGGLPLFVIVMSAVYLYKEQGEYGKSLLITFSFSIIFAVTGIVLNEEITAVAMIVIGLSTLILSSIINGVIYVIFKRNNPNRLMNQ